MRLFALTCGWLEADLRLLLEHEPGRVRLPVPSFLVEHPRGLVLFDTGLHTAIQTDAAGRLGILAQLFRSDFHPGEDVAARLASIDIDATRVPFLVTSHLHFDHCGGHAAIPNARIVIQRREWEAGHDADLMAANSYDPRDYDLGHDVLSIDGEHDLFGDGRVVCLPTHGHTPGHQSLRVRLDGGDVVLTADACYFRRTLESLHLPPIVHDREEMLTSLARLRAVRDAGAQLIYGHDPDGWADLPQAPAEVLPATGRFR